MKFALASEHQDFFNKNRLIEFEELLTASTLERINESIGQALAEKLKVTPSEIKKQNSEKLFSAGRDLWRVNEQLRKSVLNPQLAEIASLLVNTHPLRYGYDQYLQGVHSHQPSQLENSYASFLHEPRTLLQTSCVTDIACGLMICLSSSMESTTSDGVFSFMPGSGIYFSPEYPINYPALETLLGGRYLLICYVHSGSQYYLEENDPHTHELKHLGYVFGDRLNDKLHPIVWR